jgi:hypothetical protein
MGLWARVVNAWVLLSDGSALVFTGGLYNESRDSLGLRGVDGVAALGLNHHRVLLDCGRVTTDKVDVNTTPESATSRVVGYTEVI